MPPIFAATWLIFAALVSGSCSEGGGAGASCITQGECASAFQCLGEICVPRCEKNSECGDGYQCSPNGVCNLVLSSIGDPCVSEWECGLGQGCVLDEALVGSNQVLAASCQGQGSGGNIGADCESDQDCQNTLCTLGQCSQVCQQDEDCPSAHGCSLIPRIMENESALFQGCLPTAGVFSHTIAMTESAARLSIPVPSDTHSIAIVSQVSDDVHSVGATRVVSPNGLLLFNGDSSPAQLIANRIRYIRQRRISTMLIPNSDNPEVELETGFYQVDMEASLPPFGPGTAVPEVTVYYKMDTARTLDLNFYFLDLSDHPCSGNFGVETLNASNAAVAGTFQDEYLVEVENILAQANINVGIVRYADIERADLDGLVGSDKKDLLRLSDNSNGLAIFFVRSMEPSGVQTVIGGVPGPPRLPGTSASGIAISADTLCYRSWTRLARVSAHAAVTQMGLWNNRDPEGIQDPIADTEGSTDNLTFFGEFGGTDLTPGQVNVLGRYPGLR